MSYTPYNPVHPKIETQFLPSSYPAATADWGQAGYEDDFGAAENWGSNFVQGMGGDVTGLGASGDYNLLITNNQQYGYGGLFFGGQYDSSKNSLTGHSAQMSSNLSNGFVIKTANNQFKITNSDGSHNLFKIVDDDDPTIDSGNYGSYAGGVVQLNEVTYGYRPNRPVGVVSGKGDIQGPVPMGIDENGHLFRNYDLQHTINKHGTDISDLNTFLSVISGISGDVNNLTQWLTSATKIQEAFLKTDDNINKVIAYVNRLNFGPKMKYISGQNPYEAPQISDINYVNHMKTLNVMNHDATTATKLNWQIMTDVYNKDISYNLFSLMDKMVDSSGSYESSVVDFRAITNLLQSKLGSLKTARVTVTLADGSVYFDSNKTDVSGNIWSKAITKIESNKIGENHNTRPAIMDTQLFEYGIAYETKYSTSDKKQQDYVAFRVGVLGMSKGTFRLSCSSTVEGFVSSVGSKSKYISGHPNANWGTTDPNSVIKTLNIINQNAGTSTEDWNSMTTFFNTYTPPTPFVNILNNIIIDSSSGYPISKSNLDQITADLTSALQKTGRVVVTLPDGTVVYDSKETVNNTWSNFNGKIINENHNTRPAIMEAQLFNYGKGYESKYSTSTGSQENYAAFRIGGLGASLGTIRFSTKATVNTNSGSIRRNMKSINTPSNDNDIITLNIKNAGANADTQSNWDIMAALFKTDKLVYKFDELVNDIVNRNMYVSCKNRLDTAVLGLTSALGGPASGKSGRILVTLPDGTVVYDSSTKTANTFDNYYVTKTINENHNTRPAIMATQLFGYDVAYETKYSTTDKKQEDYVANRLGGLGKSYGTIRYSSKKAV